jgi:hypothetical protein
MYDLKGSEFFKKTTVCINDPLLHDVRSSDEVVVAAVLRACSIECQPVPPLCDL